MGEAFLDYKKGGSSGLDINGIIQDYYVYAGEKVSAGDFVEFINVMTGQTTETSVDTQIANEKYTGWVSSAVKLDENRVFIAHSSTSGNQYLFGMICTINGATITAGTDTQLSSTVFSGYAISTVLLDNGNVFIAHNVGSTNYQLYGIVCAVTGTTITHGTDTQISAINGSGFTISAVKLTGNNVFVAHRQDITNHCLSGVVCTISDTTVNIGTDTVLVSSSDSGRYIVAKAFEDNRVIIGHSYGSSYTLYAIVCAVSNTAITCGTDQRICAVANSSWGLSIEVLDMNRVFIIHSYDSSNFYLYGMVCSVSGNAITRGTDTALELDFYDGAKISSILLPSGKVFIVHCYSQDYQLYGLVCSISGTTISKGTDTLLNSGEIGGGSNRIPLTIVQNNTIFISHSIQDGGNNRLFAQLFSIDEANNIPTNQITVAEYETQVRPATSLPCNGVANTSGEGGDDTGHKDVVSVYISDV